MRFSTRAAGGVAGDKTLTHDLPAAGCKKARSILMPHRWRLGSLDEEDYIQSSGQEYQGCVIQV
jgi:hypothetical protein